MKNKLTKNFIKYIVPSVGSMWFYSMYTMVDGIFVGNGINTKALSAVNMSTPYLAFIFAFSILLSIGSSNIISYYLGRKESKIANKYFSQTIFLSFLIGLIIGLIAYFGMNTLVNILGAKGDIRIQVINYLKIIILFTPFFITNYSFEVMVKTDGNPHLSIKYMTISALTNIFLDYLFIFVLGFNIEGAAIATGIAQTLPCIAYTIHFYSKKSKLNFVLPGIHFAKIYNSLKFGFPASVTELATGFSVFIYNKVILENLGLNGLASFSVIMYIFNLFVYTIIAINQGTQPLISFNIGRKNFENVKKLKVLMFKTVTIVSLFIFSLIQLLPKQLVLIFIKTNNLTLITSSINNLRTFSISFLILGFNVAIGGYLTAIRKPNFELLISILRGYVIVLLAIIIVPHLLGPNSIWYISTITETITLFISIYLLKINKIK